MVSPICILCLFILSHQIQSYQTSQTTSNLEEIVTRLSAHVEALQKSQQQDRITIESLKETLSNVARCQLRQNDVADAVKEIRGETDNLRVDIRRLKTDVERIRERRDEMSALHQQAVAVRWLHKSLERIRAEIAEVAAAQNVSASLRQQQKVESQLQLLNADITWLRADAEQQRAQQEKNAVSLRQTQMDVQEVQQHQKHVNEGLQKVNEEMLKIQDEIKVKMAVDQHYDGDNAIQQHWPVRLRHEKRLRKMLRDISTSQKTIDHHLRQLNQNQSNYAIDAKQIRKEIAILRNETQSEWKSKESILDALRSRVVSLETTNSQMVMTMHNVTILSSSTEKLHTSTIQLFEALESVESTCVNGVAMLRSELSKMEFNVAQLSSSVTVLREDENAFELTLQSPNRDTGSTKSSIDLNLKNTLSATVASTVTEDPVDLFIAQVTNTKSSVTSDGALWSQHLPFDCTHVDPSVRGSGVYLINPLPSHKEPVETFCDIQSNGIRWTVIQRRLDSSLDFDRTWLEYQKGFGDPANNFWLGNDAIHAITTKNPHLLHIDLWDHDGQYFYAEYSQFSVSSQDDGYRLHLNGYRGNASNSFHLHNKARFSTKDKDNDASSQHCAELYSGGWWYGRCQYVNINSNIDAGFVWFDLDQNVWLPLVRVQMKIRKI